MEKVKNKLLADFAAIVLKDHLKDFILKEVSELEHNPIPSLQFLYELEESQKMAILTESAEGFLNSLVNNTALDLVEERLKKWENDELEPGIKRKSLGPAELIKIYHIQKTSLYKFIPLYTSDIEEGLSIVNILDNLYVEFQNKGFEMLLRLQKKSEESLLEAQYLAQIGNFERNLITEKVTFSKGFAKIFEVPFDEEMDRSILLKNIVPEDRDKVEKHLNNAIKNENKYNIYYNIHVSNKIKTIHSTGEVIRKNDRPYLLRGTLQDVTDLFEQRRLNDLKDEFIGIASHELKTPLTSMKAYMQLLDRTLNSNNKEVSRTYLQKTIHHINRLENLIRDFLDLSKINAGNLNLQYSHFDFDELVQECVDSIRQSVKTHQIIVRGKAGRKIEADKQRLEQVIYNVVNNGIKYSSNADKIIIEIGYGFARINIRVQDFGIGIPKESFEHLFKRFYRVESTSARYQGMGIGLYITNEIIKKHSGKLWVESTIGKGTTFHISLPVNQKK